MTEWSRVTVESCLESLALRKMPKVLLRNYKPSGRFPIVDQGQNLIAGWTDDDGGVISTDLPVVVFGDHTRAFKYVDFPFVRGADGTQVLKPKPGIDPLFFYYACKAIDLPGRGYNRHFRVLKETEIPIPSLHEQRSIAHALRRVDYAISLQDEQLRTLTDLKRAAMHTLFTRGLRGEPQKETEIGPVPESWEETTLGELCDIVSGGTPSKSVAGYWGGSIPWVSGKDLKSPALNDSIDHVTDEGVQSGTHLAPEDSVLLLVRGMGLAKDLPVAVINRPMAFNQDIKALIPRGDHSGSFVRSAIYVSKERMLSQVVTSAHGTMTLNLNDVETFQISYPLDSTEADEIVELLATIDGKIDLHRRKRAVLEDLFKALLHKLMTGEIRMGELGISALSGNAAMGKAPEPVRSQ